MKILKQSLMTLLLFAAFAQAETQLEIITTTLPDGMVGEEYSEYLEATGCEVEDWSIVDGEELPPGLRLDYDGEIWGKPEEAGTFTFKVKAECEAQAITETISITIDPLQAPKIRTTNLPNGKVGADYSKYIHTIGYVEDWSIESGSLPPGLKLDDDGEIYGTISATAVVKAYTFKVKAENAAGFDTATFTINVIMPSKPMIITTSLPISTVGEHYREYIEASDYAEWSKLSGTLPPGLRLDDDGEIWGWSEEAGTYTFKVKAENVAGFDTATFTITIESQHIPVITTTSLPNGKVEKRYSKYLEATGGRVEWSKLSGTLPPGLQLDDDGEIWGYPEEAGTYTFTVKATNLLGSVTKQLSIKIDPPEPPVITISTLPNGTVGRGYDQYLITSLMEDNIRWNIVNGSGTLPPGLSLDDDGEIWGTPTTAGIYTFTVKATNTAGSDTKVLSIKINATLQVPTITTTSLPSGIKGEEYLQRIDATELAVWSVVEGELPPGLWLYEEMGFIYGTPAVAGTYTFKLKATNAAGSSAVVPLSITIGPSTPIRLPQIASNRNISVQTDANAIMLSNLPLNAKIDVYNLQGKHIYSSNSGNSQILRIPVQTKGMYIIKAGNQAMRATVR